MIGRARPERIEYPASSTTLSTAVYRALISSWKTKVGIAAFSITRLTFSLSFAMISCLDFSLTNWPGFDTWHKATGCVGRDHSLEDAWRSPASCSAGPSLL